MLEERILKVGLVQMEMAERRYENMTCARELVHEAAAKGAEIVCLPELFSLRYFAQAVDRDLFALAEKDVDEPGTMRSFLKELAADVKVMLVGGSFYEVDSIGVVDNTHSLAGVADKSDSTLDHNLNHLNLKYYNTSLVVDSRGEVVGKYRKIHIPQDKYYYEQFYFSSGNLGYVQVQHEKAKVAPLICYDQWFAEAARANVLVGAEVLFYPTAIGWFNEMKKEEPFAQQRWVDAMRSHASLNGVYTVAVNRVWVDGELNFWGSSFVADPYGQIVAQCSDNRAEVLVVELDMNLVRKSQESWGFLGNRKPQTYGGIVR